LKIPVLFRDKISRSRENLEEIWKMGMNILITLYKAAEHKNHSILSAWPYQLQKLPNPEKAA
jgi:hypothetical protein